MTQGYILIEGGLVVNQPSLPVLDLDVLEDEFVDESTVREVQALLEEADTLGVDRVVERCQDWLRDHAHLVPIEPDPDAAHDRAMEERAWRGEHA